MTPAIIAKFWDRVEVKDASACWPWKGTVSRYGYGKFCPTWQTAAQAHRFSYELANGPIPEGMVVCHRCDVRGCVNPAHLFLGTQTENLLDMTQKGRRAKGNLVALNGEKNGRAKLSGSEVEAIRIAYPICKSYRELAKRFNVDHTTIARVVKGKTWAA